VPKGWHTQTYEAQAVAARSYTLATLHPNADFDLYPDQRSQMYGGLERSTAMAEKLVDETRGMFLLYEGRLVRTFYSSACGGHTEPAWEVLGDETEKMAPLSGTKCEYCQRRAIFRWKEPVLIPKKEIAEKCLPKDLQDKRVKSVEVTKTLPGGHAVEVSATGSGPVAREPGCLGRLSR